MSKTKRMRVFAGPNGSGKTTIIKELESQYSFGVYINADDIELTLLKSGQLNLAHYQLTATSFEIQDFFRQSTFAPIRLNNPELWRFISVKDNFIVISKDVSINSYIAADIAEWLRRMLLQQQSSLTYETVMSHVGKLDFMSEARKKGYRVYLYYIATNDPDININRVNIRMAQKGHGVDPAIIRNRYYKSLSNLKQALKYTDRAFVFDNSGEHSKLLAEVTNGREVHLQVDSSELPKWFIDYLL